MTHNPALIEVYPELQEEHDDAPAEDEVPAIHEVQPPPVSVDVPEEALYFPTPQAAN